ncbi:GNAT family N-acetyltransferase [Actinoplanes digitatis]|uniref:GNAT family N-acetyltransferase n=1 Tax=Actinoplanes digitatis TaxID=1868 RepID=UPI0021AAF852|nr:GNAT family N-acetyltransferase [Actinoplanes digitatis]
MITVRPAAVADVESLVRLRVTNAEAHLALDPETYRVPARDAVLRHFTAMLADGSQRNAVLVAELAGHVVGMVEVLRNPDPPDHQILRPELSAAQIHTVVAEDARDRGAGAALIDAAVTWAADHGITYLSAGIHHRNAGAVRFYGRHGFADYGRLMGRQVTGRVQRAS